MALSERQDVFSLFADVLAEKGLSRHELLELPLLSDPGTALRSYAEGNTEREGYHRHHYLCYPHLLGSIGSGTIVALLARGLPFMITEKAFKDIYPQTIADFVLGCRQNLISAPSRRKFAELFGVDLAGWNGNGSPRTNIINFKKQALWRLNQQVKKLCSLRNRFATVTSAIIDRASNWSQKIQCGWC
jgi:hypothetical protein